MKLLSWTDADLVFERDYNVRGRRLFPWSDVDAPGWEGAWVVLAGGEVSTPHVPDENEMFFIAEGGGTMRIGAEKRPVRFGDTVFIPHGQEHELANDGADRLVYLSIWWLPS